MRIERCDTNESKIINYIFNKRGQKIILAS